MALPTNPVAVISALWRYPVKSMLGEQLPTVDLTPGGIVGDRAFALVDRETGHVVSAKNPRKWPMMFACRAAFVAPPHQGQPLPVIRISLPNGEEVLSSDNAIESKLSSALGRSVALQSSPDSAACHSAEMSDAEALDRVSTFDTPAGTYFDLAPLHLLTTATLARLEELSPSERFAVPRFRPNLVLTTDTAGFVENDWVGRTLRVGDTVRLRITEPCPRCVMTTLLQGDLPRDPNILRAIAHHNGGNLGVYASVLEGGVLRQGDSCTLL